MELTSVSPERRGANGQRISPSRLQVARLRRGLTKADLANRIGISPSTLSKWEVDGPPAAKVEALLELLVSALDFPPDFFTADEVDIPSLERTLFRAGSRATQRQKLAAISSGVNAKILLNWLRSHFNYPSPDIPDLTGIAPAEAARYVRSVWALGDMAIPNSIQLAESKGVTVIGLPPAASAVDAFSLWGDDQPFIFLARRRTPEGTRFDLAHELGHLLLHSRSDPDSSTDRETEANEFASEFLIPTDVIHANLRLYPSLDDILRLKSKLKVSAMAALMAVFNAGKLSDSQYRQYAGILSSRGFRTSEPGSDLQYERSRVFDFVFSPEGGQTARSIADATHIPVQDLNFLTLNAAASAVPGLGPKVPSAPASASSHRPNLRIVKS
ncbi:ImmA/IrrE family metallo-endopeptidase [Corynebacterium sp. Marseille-P3884]|uniref:helix-turn-helix domain-containing protein n=1 Tax=Corynebacterium sp. Marseille-P3884 TaxID=2495409 RepID=UPI0024A78B66|nr:ImmA/IrrE family metallo-endopeptidase [Corynebacterium sp. Marseille-P3884]